MSRLRRKATGWGARVRFGEGRDEWFSLPHVAHDNEPLAKDRHRRLQRLADLLKVAGKHAEARAILEQAAKETTEKAFRNVEVVVEGFAPEEATEDKPQTFRQVAQLYTSGTLRELYPDDVPFKGPASLEESRNQLACFLPELGDLTFDRITLDHIDRAKRLVPKDLAPRTRLSYLRSLRRVMQLAVVPLRLVEHTVTVSLPKGVKGASFTFLYPSEDRLLLACLEIPFEYRFLYAFLDRNGTRISETLRLDWGHVDLERGSVHIEAAWTKTKRARHWMLDEGTLLALTLRKAQMETELGRELTDQERVFVGPRRLRDATRMKLGRQTVRARFRGDLKRAGLTRKELLVPMSGTNPLRVHDLRASFVTLARALGRPDRWIMDRSGHESAAVLEQYDRGVRHAREMGLGWFDPMALALGMSGALPSEAEEDTDLDPTPLPETLGQAWAKAGFSPRNMGDLPVAHERIRGPPEGINPAKTEVPGRPMAPSDPLGPAGISISGQKLAQPDEARDSTETSVAEPSALPPETAEDAALRALAFAIEEATKVQRWDVVLACTHELARRQLARNAPSVPSLDAARKRRDEGGGK